MTDQRLRFVPEPEGAERLRSYGIPYPKHELVQEEDQAVAAAKRLGFPVVLKVVSLDVVHKSDAGGVIANLSAPQEVREAFTRIRASVAQNVPEAAIEGLLVCAQEPEGLEVIVGGLEDPVFGPAVMFGLGGIYTEVFKDVVFGIAPLGKKEALEMVAGIKGRALLEGLRGRPPLDKNSLARLLVRVSRLMAKHREIKQLDLNPVRVYHNGLSVLDVRIFEQPPKDSR